MTRHPFALAHVRRAPALDEILRREILAAGVAECASVAWARVGASGVRVALGEAGGASLGEGARVYDLASVTKPLTATVVARTIADGHLDWDTTVSAVLGELSGSACADATIAQLLSHRAGLPAWGVLYREDPWALGEPRSVPPLGEVSAAQMLERAASRRGLPGQELYSDVGYVLLGEIAARVTGAPLPRAWAALGCEDARGRRAREPSILARMPRTERVDWRGDVHGEVHDENAAVLLDAGGNPGHAGAFGTALEVAAFAARFLGALTRGDGLLPPEIARAMVEPIPGGTHALGWDRRSGARPSSGARFGPRTFGHLGFTGTSVWIDPDAGAIAVLLTNRTWPSRANVAIRDARPRVHDALWAIEP